MKRQEDFGRYTVEMTGALSSSCSNKHQLNKYTYMYRKEIH